MFKVLFGENVAQIHQIVKCTNCGLMYAFPLPVRNFDRYAAKNPTLPPLKKGDPTILHSLDKLPDYKSISADLQKYVPKGRILEIGCYVGTFLWFLREQGWDALGVELDARAVQFAREEFGLTILNDTIESMDTIEHHDSFEATCMLHLIEHLDDPASMLEVVWHLLKPGGVLVIETPTFDSLMFKLLERRERSLSCNGHIVFYTVDTLSRLLERIGFKVIFWKKIGRTLSLGRLLWNLGVMSKSTAVQQSVQGVINRFDLLRSGPRLYLNMGDMVRMYSRKPFA
jgi:2-polyprenyl-3-methyl-5-hydroxy-6-metoxy-1,4-benzoquinol methylase